jgi:hypothetical protein
VVVIAMEQLSLGSRETNSMICVSLAGLYLLFKDGIGGRSIGKLMIGPEGRQLQGWPCGAACCNPQ